MGAVCCKSSQEPRVGVPIDEAPLDKALNGVVPGSGKGDVGVVEKATVQGTPGRAELNESINEAQVLRNAAVATGAAGIVAQVAAAAADSGAAAAGQAMLEIGKGLPFVAPVAFLVAAVANAASEAVIMKRDCYEFRRVVCALEKVLVKAKNLEHHKDDIEYIKETLQEALELVKKFQQRGWMSAMAMATVDMARLAEIKTALGETLQRMQLASQVGMEVFQEAQFQQAEDFKAKVEAMGGAEACAADPAKMKELEEYMSASDKLLIAKLDAAAADTKDTKMVSRKSLKLQEEVMAAQQDMRADINSKFADMQKEAEITRLRNELLERQVGELTSLLSDVKGMMQKFPVPASEPERLYKVHETGVMGMTKEADGYAELEKLAYETFERIGGQGSVGWNFLDEDKSFMPVMIRPGGEAAADDGSTLQKAAIMNGVWQPRKANICQHVVATGASVTVNGMSDPNMPPMATFDELRMIADRGMDKGIKDMMEENASTGATMPEGFPGSSPDDKRCPVTPGFVEEIVKSGGEMFYHGEPIKMDGETLGSYCVLAPKKPEGFDEIVESGFFKKQVEKAEEVLRAQAKIRRERQLAQMNLMMQPQAPPLIQAQAMQWHQLGMAALPPAGVQMGPMPMMMGQQGIPMVNPAYLQMMQAAQPMNLNPMMPPSRAQLEMQMAQMSAQNAVLMQQAMASQQAQGMQMSAGQQQPAA